jgi:DNA invertase Pin-like site-specific DNA recombinase
MVEDWSRSIVLLVANMVESSVRGEEDGGERAAEDHVLAPVEAGTDLVRQSTLLQTRENTESTARQYGLADRARELGWAPCDIEVVDADLGVSGRFSGMRAGFQQLVSRVCLGEVGAVFGLEVSRLARSSAEFGRLLEFARLTDTLLIDADGVYDLGDFNDRLVLGLKSTMSEAELHILAGRLQGARKAAAERGDLRLPLPVGMVYADDGTIVVDPDEEVRAAVADVFAFFDQHGSALAVVRAFAGRRFPCRDTGVWDGRLAWGRLTHGRAAAVLKNPVYAGAYVFGRSVSSRKVRPDGTVVTVVSQRSRDQWAVLTVTTMRAISPGSSICRSRRSWPPTALVRRPGRRARGCRCVRASSSAARVASR